MVGLKFDCFCDKMICGENKCVRIWTFLRMSSCPLALRLVILFKWHGWTSAVSGRGKWTDDEGSSLLLTSKSLTPRIPTRVTDPDVQQEPLSSTDVYLCLLAVSTSPLQCCSYELACLWGCTTRATPTPTSVVIASCCNAFWLFTAVGHSLN